MQENVARYSQCKASFGSPNTGSGTSGNAVIAPETRPQTDVIGRNTAMEDSLNGKRKRIHIIVIPRPIVVKLN